MVDVSGLRPLHSSSLSVWVFPLVSSQVSKKQSIFLIATSSDFHCGMSASIAALRSSWFFTAVSYAESRVAHTSRSSVRQLQKSSSNCDCAELHFAACSSAFFLASPQVVTLVSNNSSLPFQ